MASITISGIEKSFGDARVLERIDLDVAHGEFLTLVGPSGCGKSTLLRIIAGLEGASAGQVHIGDRRVDGVRAADRNLAMVFQSYALYPHLTVAENMLTPLKLRDLSARERLPFIGPLLSRAKRRALAAQVQDVAEVLKIEALLGRKPGQLSGGQRQRAALGRAMVRKPAAFLMDEPLSNLDAALRVHMRAELAELHRHLGATFIYVTHDQAEALTMSDRMAVMMDGRILQIDAPQTVYDDPAELAVAEFVGSPKINVLPGEIDGAGRAFCLGAPLSRFIAAPPGPVAVGLRPEHLALVDASDPDGIDGQVVHAEHLGSDVYLHAAIAAGEHRVVARALPAEAAALGVGAPVRIGRRRGEAMVFAPSGARLRFVQAPAPARTDESRVA
ncbi:MAG: ABC transporter ATP-binding protein [Pseudomonadota bacterium]